jgi:hypothetical protein
VALFWVFWLCLGVVKSGDWGMEVGRWEGGEVCCGSTVEVGGLYTLVAWLGCWAPA